MKAVGKFKRLVDPSKAVMHSILGQEHDSHLVQPPMQMEDEDEGPEGLTLFKRILKEKELSRHKGSTGNNSRDSSFNERDRGRSPKRQGSDNSIANINNRNRLIAAAAALSSSSSRADTPSRSMSEATRGQARDPLEEEVTFLHIGPSTFTGYHDDDQHSHHYSDENTTTSQKQRPVLPPLNLPDTSMDGIPEFPQTTQPIDSDAVPIVSESPGASEIDIYETAYREEIERIKKRSTISSKLDAGEARTEASPSEDMNIEADQATPTPTPSTATMTRVYLNRRVERQKKHLDEVLRMVQEQHQHQEQENKNKNSDSTIMHVGDKLSGSIAQAGAAFTSALAKGATSVVSPSNNHSQKTDG
jgi:calcium/calmodulin-dependent protein kinase kinase 2